MCTYNMMYTYNTKHNVYKQHDSYRAQRGPSIEQVRDNVCVPVFRGDEKRTGSSLVRAPPLPVRVCAGGSEEGLRYV